MKESLQVLKENRDAVLLSEVAMWIHMFSKYQESAITRSKANADVKVPCEIVKENGKLHKLLDEDWPGKMWTTMPVIKSDDRVSKLSFKEVIAKHRSVEKAKEDSIAHLLKLIVDSHGRSSGTEKGILKGVKYSRQGGKRVWLASVMGYEDEPIDLNALGKRKKELWAFLEHELSYLKGRLQQEPPLTVDEWEDWRTPFIKRLREDFSTVVGDTRRPINDVTIWDQTMASVAFFKSELAYILLTDEWKNPYEAGSEKNSTVENPQKDTQKDASSFKPGEIPYLYRILRISTSGYEFITRSSKMADILARQDMLNRAWDSIKVILEVEYPLSYEIYRDINGITFLTPDIPNLLQWKDEEGNTLGSLIEKRLYEELGGEVDVNISLSSIGSRSIFNLGSLVEKREPYLTASPGMLEDAWKERGDKCAICQIRPQGFGAHQIYKKNIENYRKKALERGLCCHCMKRLEGRSKRWCTQERGSTIWVEEVADSNARVALLTAKFGLDEWINGEFISSFSLLDFTRLKKKINTLSFDAIVKELSGCKEDELKSRTLFSQLWEIHAKNIGTLSKILVDNDDLGESHYSHLSHGERLALAVWRKNPSFARLQRIWETTEGLWQDNVIPMLGNSQLAGKSQYRLILKGTLVHGNLGDYHVYEIRKGRAGIGLSFVWDPCEQHFISAFNIDYAAKLILQEDSIKNKRESIDILKEYLEGFPKLLIMTESASNSPRLHEVSSLSNPKIEVRKEPYVKAIPILSEPTEFMVLLPADRAVATANYIQNEYQIHFSKVKNRLPLHLNILFFSRHQPLYVAMDASRRMLERRTPIECTWKIEGIREADPKEHGNARLGNRVKDLQLKFNTQGGSSYILNTLVSYSAGDCAVMDEWHPYFFLKGDSESISERDLRFKAPLPGSKPEAFTHLVHVSELRPDDEVYYTPSTFDFEFLDISARRFELFYDEYGRRLPRPYESYSTRPYLLEELSDFQLIWNTIAKYLTYSKVKELQGLLQEKRFLWQVKTEDDKTLRGFAKQVLLQLFGGSWNNIEPEMQKKLEDWATNGSLNDVLELYTEILKEKPEEILKL